MFMDANSDWRPGESQKNPQPLRRNKKIQINLFMWQMFNVHLHSPLLD